VSIGASRSPDGCPEVVVESDQLIASGDGMEADSLGLSWGQTVRIGIAGERLRLVR